MKKIDSDLYTDYLLSTFGGAKATGLSTMVDEKVSSVVKRQFGYVKVRYRGLKKNTAQLGTLFALSNLWMVHRKLMEAQGLMRPKAEPRL